MSETAIISAKARHWEALMQHASTATRLLMACEHAVRALVEDAYPAARTLIVETIMTDDGEYAMRLRAIIGPNNTTLADCGYREFGEQPDEVDYAKAEELMDECDSYLSALPELDSSYQSNTVYPLQVGGLAQ